MNARFSRMFARCGREGAVAFIPFVTLGDPDVHTSAAILDRLVDSGADALELGIPFSDPVADGPVLQAAAVRALAAGVRVDDCLALIRHVRDRHPDLPIGLLGYANTVVARGLDDFYRDVARAGVDAVLVADLPLGEGSPFDQAATAAGVAPVYVAPPNLGDATLRELARRTREYTYVTARPGVTGTRSVVRAEDLAPRLQALAGAGAPPAVIGFGISTPDDVSAARDAGAAGVIVGSELVRRLHQGDAGFDAYLASLRHAARGAQPAGC